MLSPQITLNVITHDPPDNRVLECAVTAESRFIVTGDDDLLRIGAYEGIRILKVAEFLDFARHPGITQAQEQSAPSLEEHGPELETREPDDDMDL